MSSVILDQLKEKLDIYDLWDIAKEFYNSYKLADKDIYPEIHFDNDVLPSDDCFQTLVAVKKAMNTKTETEKIDLTDYQIKSLLGIPYQCIQETQAVLCEVLDYPISVVEQWYSKSLDMFYVTTQSVKETHKYLSARFASEIYKPIFREAVLLGCAETKRRIDSLKEAIGELTGEVLYEMYGRNGRQGYLLYPYYAGSVAAIEALKKALDYETVAHVLKTDFWLLYAYKDESYQGERTYGHDQEYFDKIVMIYKEQETIADILFCLSKSVSQDKCERQWNEQFVPSYQKIKSMLPRYPICPKLQKAIFVVVTAFNKCGMSVTDEYARYLLE